MVRVTCVGGVLDLNSLSKNTLSWTALDSRIMNQLSVTTF